MIDVRKEHSMLEVTVKGASVLTDVSLLDMVLHENNLMDGDRIRLLPADTYKDIAGTDSFKAWCLRRARYGIPTQELVDWLKERIGDRKAIEIGAGNADLGYHLGILQTDNYQQTKRKDMLLLYALFTQNPTRPLPDVVPIDAESAVAKYKPEVVIGSWITRKFIMGTDIEGVAQANMYGVIEEKILKGCCEYIHIGHLDSHNQKTLLSLPHETYQFPWIVSRAGDQSKNVIYVWKNSFYPTGRRNK